MAAQTSDAPHARNASRQVVALRVVFGLVWAIDAVLKWLPGFRNSLSMDVMGAAQGQPHWLNWWFNFWMTPMMDHEHLFAYLIAIAESLIAAALLVGFARKSVYVLGGVFSLLIWGIGEGFGGPYTSGTTDIGAGIVYAVLFYALYRLERALPHGWSADVFISQKVVWWKKVAKP